MQIAFQPLLNAPARLGSWWISELTPLVPERVLDLGRSFAIIDRRGDQWFATVMRRGRVIAEGHLVDSVVQKALDRHRSQSEQPSFDVHLRPMPAEILSRTVSVPSRVVPQFARILRLEMDRWTPFDYDELFVVSERIDGLETGASATVQIRFIQRATVQAWCDELRDLGVTPSHLVLVPQRSRSISLKDYAAHRQPGFKAWLVPAVVVLAWVVAACVDVAVALSDRTAWQERLAVERQALSEQRKLQDEITRTLATIRQGEIARANPRGALLASLSASLPGTDWLNELSIKGDMVTLRGYALKLDDLAKALERFAQPGELQFQGEASYDARTERMRFAASFRLPETAR